MKRIIQTSLIAGALLTLFSFTNSAELDFAGTYGVSVKDRVEIELQLNEDKTFAYKDLSNPSKPINVKGDWTVKNNTILLQNYDSEFSFHLKWKIVKDGMVAKSRNGLAFYSLSRK